LKRFKLHGPLTVTVKKRGMQLLRSLANKWKKTTPMGKVETALMRLIKSQSLANDAYKRCVHILLAIYYCLQSV